MFFDDVISFRDDDLSSSDGLITACIENSKYTEGTELI